MQEVVQLLSPVNATGLFGGGGLDISFWMQDGVPGGSLGNKNENYFHFHHTQADTMSALDPHDVSILSTLLYWNSLPDPNLLLYFLLYTMTNREINLKQKTKKQ